MEAEYIAACEAAKEAVWLRKFFTDLEVVPDMDMLVVKIEFCAPDQIEITKRSESGGTGSFKIFQNLFESLGFIHILILCLKISN